MVGFGHVIGDPSLVDAPAGGVRTLTLRDTADPPAAPELLNSHALLLVTAGHGSVEVDFTAYPCRPGTLVWARPGQVLRCPARGLDAVVVCWSASLPLFDGDVADDPGESIHWQLVGEDEDAVINEISQLVVDCERYHAGDVPAELLHHQLAVLTLRIAALGGATGSTGSAGSAGSADPAGAPSGPEAASGMDAAGATTGSDGHGTREPADSDAFRRFRRAVERCYAQTRRVEDYAAMLGCSVRTLTRASLAATGRSAKQVVDDRVALQARRLLAATDEPVAEIGHRLGFPEPTNFGRFFHREVGCSPGGFRAAAHRHLASSGAAHAPRRP